MRADRAIQRGVRTGLSQSQPLSQGIQDLPEEDDKLPESPEVDEDEYSLQVERGDTMQSIEIGRGSGIGIFSQEGMVRVGRLDTDSDSELGGHGMDDEGSSIYHSFQPNVSDIESTDAVAGNDSDRSFMSVQESMVDANGDSKPSSKDAPILSDKMGSKTPVGGDDAVTATAISGGSRDSRSDHDSDDEHLSKKARTKV
ncbi:hypothetical protein FBU30_000366 [Linnemannia zychae]|nr:hypothetical protein FBU30_000366 [Linnemannia zychae]